MNKGETSDRRQDIMLATLFCSGFRALGPITERVTKGALGSEAERESCNPLSSSVVQQTELETRSQADELKRCSGPFSDTPIGDLIGD